MDSSSIPSSYYPAGIINIHPLNRKIDDRSTWSDRAACALFISEYLLKESRDLKWVNPTTLDFRIHMASGVNRSRQAFIGKDLDALRQECGLDAGMIVTHWVNNKSKPLEVTLSEIALNRYSRMSIYIMEIGGKDTTPPQVPEIYVLAANAEKIYLIDVAGHRMQKAALVEIRNYVGIGNYLPTNVDDLEYRISTISYVPQEPKNGTSEVKIEKIEDSNAPSDQLQEEERNDEVPTPMEVEDDEEEKKEVEKEEEDEEDEEELEEEEEEEEEPKPKTKKRAVGIRRKRSTRTKKKVRSKTTRGTGGDIIVIDEAAHVPKDLFYETIVPILELKNTSLLCISTPMDDFNFYSMLLDRKDDEGIPFFNTIRAGRVCDDCQSLSYEQMIMCDHVQQTAHWKSVAKHKRIRLLYDGDEAKAARELKGIVASSYIPCFEKSIIEGCFVLPKIIIEAAPRQLFITADPTGGGPSKLAIMSGYFDAETLVITGLDAQSARNHVQEKSLLLRHVAALRQNFPGTHIWFIPENNLGLEGSHLEKFVRKIPALDTYYEKEDGRSGVRKSDLNTSDYQIRVEDMLIKKDIRVANNVFTVSKGFNAETIITELRNQLERYHWEAEEDDKGNTKTHMTGKMGGAQDDLYIALAMLCYWGKKILRDKRIGLI